MLATVFLLLFLFIVPKKLKKTGIKYMMENRRQGLFLFILSRIIFWFIVLQIGKIWVPDLEMVLYGFVGIGATYQFILERRNLTLAIKKKPSLK